MLKIKKTYLVIYILLLALTIVGIIWSFLWWKMCGVALYDGNFHVFHFVLSKEQGIGIIKQTKRIILLFILPLVATNLGWILLSLWIIVRCKGTASSR